VEWRREAYFSSAEKGAEEAETLRWEVKCSRA